VTRRLLLVALVAALLVACSDDNTTSTEKVRVVTQNLLHGVVCPTDSNRCDLPDRVALFVQQLDAKGCPELVGIQEANADTVRLLRDGVKGVCAGRYHVVSDGDAGLDREVVLTTDRVLASRRTHLAGPLRTALWVRVATDAGIVDFVTTHLASSSDDRPCDRTTCPRPCRVDERINSCQAKQVAAFALEVADDDGVLVLAGDFNAHRDQPAMVALRAAGFTDAHDDAGNGECDAATGSQCTSGRIDNALTDLTDPTSKQTERIDYVLFGGSRSCHAVSPTGLFNEAPDDGKNGIVFPSDHTAVQATLACRTTDSQRDAATDAKVVRSSTTTAPTTGTVDTQTLAGITAAYQAVFNGDITDIETKLAAIEDAELIRSYFIESYERSKEVAAKVRVRIDAATLVDATNANVTYTLLLEDNAVLDHLPGSAVKKAGRWLVTRRTYCEVSTQGTDDIPAPCRDIGQSRP
jgi:endonuclease/exonuclease/phosphatase family metal-dependent hydrolase